MNPNADISPESLYSEGPSRILKTKSCSKKAPSPYHGKVEGNKRIRLPYECARSVFQLCNKLGHHSPCQTIEWLLNEAKSSVRAVLEANPTLPATIVQDYHPPLLPPVPVIPSNQDFNSAPFSESTSGGFDFDEEITKYFCASY